MSALHEETLRELVAAGVARDVLVHRDPHSRKWMVSVRTHGVARKTLRSERKAVRTWANLQTVADYLDTLGVVGFSVEQ